jgi:NADP-dependent 3-hydroxy acid dehydrogenase YdfG
VRGKVAVVTGAGSGIGQALAVELARSGAKLAISDADTEGLAGTKERLKAIGTPVKADRLDVTERERFLGHADEVKKHFRVVNQRYNNAGIAFAGDVEVAPFKDFERVMDLDFWGVVNGTKAFLPASDHLRRRPHHQCFQRVWALLGTRAGRLQLGKVRGARPHRGAAPDKEPHEITDGRPSNRA